MTTTNPEQLLRRIIGRAELLLANMPDYRHARALLAPSPIQASRTDGTRTGRGDHADPTLGHVLSSLGEHDTDDFHDALIGAAGSLDYALDDQRRTISSTHNRPRSDDEQLAHERRMRAGRCICTDPTCDRQADFRFDSGTTWAGYSRTCRDRERQALYRADVTPPVTPSATVPASFDQSANATATCGRCGWTTPALNVNDAQWLLEKHHADGCRP